MDFRVIAYGHNGKLINQLPKGLEVLIDLLGLYFVTRDPNWSRAQIFLTEAGEVERARLNGPKEGDISLVELIAPLAKVIFEVFGVCYLVITNHEHKLQCEPGRTIFYFAETNLMRPSPWTVGCLPKPVDEKGVIKIVDVATGEVYSRWASQLAKDLTTGYVNIPWIQFVQYLPYREGDQVVDFEAYRQRCDTAEARTQLIEGILAPPWI